MKEKIVRIGFDLDGVVINKPWFVPHTVMEKLVRIHKNHTLSYRYPKSPLERKIRILSHNPKLRPPIYKNIEIIKNLSKSKKNKLYVVSSRYAFLEKRTVQWFKYYKLRKFFKEIHINYKNEQPHIFKEKMIKKLKLDVFIDDDKPLLEYLERKVKNVKLLFVTDYRDLLIQ